MIVSDVLTTFFGVSNSSILLYSSAVLLLIYLVLAYFNEDYKGASKTRLPPGPPGLPLLGYYPFLGKRPHETLSELKKKYGGVFSLRLGSTNCVVLADAEVMKEAYNKDAFHGRPPDSPFTLSSRKGNDSLIQFGGKQWTSQRRFSLTVLRDLGFGKTRMEDVIRDEVDTMIREFESSPRTPEMFHHFLGLSTANVIGVLLFGRQFPYNDPKRKILDDYLTEISYFHDQMSPHVFFSWAKHIIYKLPFLNYERARYLVKHLTEFTTREIDNHHQTLDPENTRDYIDSYILENQKSNENKQTFPISVLNGNIALFLRAGSLTTRATVEWAMLGTALHLDVQARVHQEIDKVIGRDRKPLWSDHHLMPYTVAVLNETQRWRTIVPINLLRYTREDTSVGGYQVPKGTVVITNLWGIHNDETYWPEPEKFKPERMLNKEGTGIIKSDAFVSFSVGRRACPGQSLANMEMFLYYATLLQRYSVNLPEGEPIPTVDDLKGDTHITAHPKNLRLVLTKRE